MSLGLRLESQALIRIPGTEHIERDALLRQVGIRAVDRLHLQQREVLLPRLGRAHTPANGVAGLRVEAANLRLRDVDVVRTREIVPIGAAQEAEPLGKQLQRAFRAERDVRFEQRVLDEEDQVLLSQARGVLDAQSLGHDLEVGNGLASQFGDVHGTTATGEE